MNMNIKNILIHVIPTFVLCVIGSVFLELNFKIMARCFMVSSLVWFIYYGYKSWSSSEN